MLKHMRYIYTVYKEGSFRKAAQKLYISQPALSKTIKQVESELQTPLFDRSATPIRLTSAGEYYIRSIEEIMRIEDNMKEYFAELASKAHKGLRIGGSPFFCTYILPPIIEQFQKLHPSADISLTEESLEMREELLRKNELNFVMDADLSDKNMFVSLPWKRESIILAVPSGLSVNDTMQDFRYSFREILHAENKSLRKPPVNLSCFAEEKFLLFKSGSELNKRSIAMCKNAGFSPNISMLIDQTLSSYYFASEGMGIAFIRPLLLKYVVPTKNLWFYYIDDPLAEWETFISYKRTASFTDIQQKFLDFFLNYSDEN